MSIMGHREALYSVVTQGPGLREAAALSIAGHQGRWKESFGPSFFAIKYLAQMIHSISYLQHMVQKEFKALSPNNMLKRGPKWVITGK